MFSNMFSNMFFSRIFLFLFVGFFCYLLSSCDYESRNHNNLPNCIKYHDLRGTAEINGSTRWLSIAEVTVGITEISKSILFFVGGHTLECDDYQEVVIDLLTDINEEVSGSYEILPGSSEQMGFAKGDYFEGAASQFNNIQYELISGTVTITELALTKFEISVDAIAFNGDTITLEFTNAY